MNATLTASAVFCAALISGCSSAPTLPEPTGEWEVFEQKPAPVLPAVLPATQAVPVAQTSQPPIGLAPQKPAIAAPQSTAVAINSKPAPTPILAVAAPGLKAAAPTVAASHPPPPSPGLESKPALAKPAMTATVAPSKSFGSTPSVPAVTVVAPLPKPIAPAPIPKPVWEAKVGDSLRKVITAWSQRASYTLDWQAEDLDYPIEAPLHFEGTYEEAIASIFQLYEKADRSFTVDGRRAQHRLNVAEDLNKSKRALP